MTDGYTGNALDTRVYRYVGTADLASFDVGTFDLAGATNWVLLGGTPGVAYLYQGSATTLDLNAQDYTSSSWTPIGGTPGATYRYVGPSTTTLDVNAQDYTNTTRWARLGGTPGATYRYVGPTVNADSTAVVLDLNAQDYTNTTKWARLGGTPGASYWFVGSALVGAGLDLNAQDYTNTALWAPIPAWLQGFVERMPVASDMTVDVTGNLLVEARDSAAIWANVTVVASSTTFNTGGMNVAQQELNNFVPADYSTVEGTRTLNFGDTVRIAKDFIPEDYTSDAGLTTLTNGKTVRVADGYATPVFTSDSGKRLVTSGENVQLADGYSQTLGVPGAVYRYLGDNARLDLGNTDYTDTNLWAVVAGESGGVYRYLGSGASLNLTNLDYTDAATWLPLGGVPGSVYKWLGPDGTTMDLSAPAHPYTDLDWWKQSLLNQLIPQGLDFAKSDAYAVGGLVVMNDVRGGAVAAIARADVDAASVTVRALEQVFLRAVSDSSITSSGGGSFGSRGGDSIAVGGTIAANVVGSEALASIDHSVVNTTTGDVVVEAQNLSQLDAKTANLTQSAGKTVGVTLAFNTIGWRSQAFLLNTIDTLLGTR